MSLLDTQRAFLAEVSADDDTAPSTLGMAIYRNAYRARLSDALVVSFERTRRWVGEDMFDAACAHYILTHPPRSWTLDAYGQDFPALLAELFADDPEVTELAWMEWQMQQAFAAPDRGELTPLALAGAGLDEADWAGLRLLPAAGIAYRPMTHDLAALWRALAHDLPDGFMPDPVTEAIMVIWRKELQPHYRLIGHAEFAALALLLDGASFGSVAEQVGETDLAQLGEWFAGWLGDGMFSAIAR